jgi:hypothetical protein
MNFAFIGLHEAYAATGSPSIRTPDCIAQFLIRAQVHSEPDPQFHGAWFRKRDYLGRYPNGYTCHFIRPHWNFLHWLTRITQAE